MPDTFNYIKDSTFVEQNEIQYISAKTESSHKIERTYQHLSKIQSVPTSRAIGVIKLRIAPREIPELKNISSTR